MDLTERQIEREDIFQGKVLHLVKDRVRIPNGDTATREFVLHNGAVCVIPVDSDNNVVIEHQFRYAIGRTMLEIPAGKLEPGEDPLECAKRELEEETGLKAGKWTHLGLYLGSPAILRENISMYLATELYEGKTDYDDDEFIELERIPLKKLCEMVMNGEIADGKTQIAALKAEKLLG